MADTMSIDLNNQEAIAELDALIAKMDEAEAATEKMAEAGELTVESQEKQIKVIHEHSDSWSGLAAVAIPAGEGLAKTALALYQTHLLLTIGQRGYNAAVMAGKPVIDGLTSSWERLGPVATTAGTMAIKAALNLGPPALAAAVTWKGFNLVMANTGERLDELGNKTSNLDRLGTAMGRLKENAGAIWNAGPNLSAIAKGGAEALSSTVGLTKVWNEFDKSATRTADNMRENIIGLSNWIGKTGEAERAAKRLTDQMKKQQDGFAGLREAHKNIEQFAADSAESDRRGGVGKIAKNQDEADKAAGLKAVDDEIAASRKAAQAMQDALKAQQLALDGSLKKENEYKAAVIATNKAMLENKKQTDQLLEARLALAKTPAGRGIEEAFAKQSEFERRAYEEIQQEIRAIDEKGAAMARAGKTAAEVAAFVESENLRLWNLSEANHAQMLNRMKADQDAFYADIKKIRQDAEDRMFELAHERQDKEDKLYRRAMETRRAIAKAGEDFERDMAVRASAKQEEEASHRINVAEKEAKRLLDLKFDKRSTNQGDAPELARLNALDKEREMSFITVRAEDQQRQLAAKSELERIDQGLKVRLKSIDDETKRKNAEETNLEKQAENNHHAQLQMIDAHADATSKSLKAEQKLTDETEKAKRAWGEAGLGFEQQKAIAMGKLQDDLFKKAKDKRDKDLKEEIESIQKKMKANQEAAQFDFKLAADLEKQLADAKKKQEGGFGPDAILKGQKQKDVKAAFVDNARQKAMEDKRKELFANTTPEAKAKLDQKIRDSEMEDLNRARRKNLDATTAPDSAATAKLRKQREQSDLFTSNDAKDRAEYDRQRKKAGNDAAEKAAIQFGKGKADGPELIQAQVNAAKNTTDAMVSGGKLSSEQGKAIQTLIMTAANAAATADMQATAIKNMQAVIDGVQTQTADTRRRAQTSGK